MSATVAATVPAGVGTAPVSAPVSGETETLYGRNRIGARAIRAIVTAIVAGELGVPARSVDVELADDRGRLAVTVGCPVSIGRLSHAADRTGRSRHPVQSTIVERASDARGTIRDRMLELTGSTVGVVTVRLTAARIEGVERVR
jgi:hypothetical protein